MTRRPLTFKGTCGATIAIADTTHECDQLAGHAGAHRCRFHFPGASRHRCRFIWSDVDHEQVAIMDRVDAVHVQPPVIFIRLVMVNRRTGELREYFSRYLILEERVALGRAFVANDPAEGTPGDWDPLRVLPAGVPR